MRELRRAIRTTERAATKVAVLNLDLDRFNRINDNLGHSVGDNLPRPTSPTLLIWGDKDTLMAEPVRCALREVLPKARVHEFLTYGHNPAWDDPAAVAALINPFINETNVRPHIPEAFEPR